MNIHYELVGLREQPILTGKEVEEFWEALTWGVFAALALDAYLKYRKAGDFAKFARKHWLDLLTLALVPLFAGFKIANMSVKLVKGPRWPSPGSRRSMERGR